MTETNLWLFFRNASSFGSKHWRRICTIYTKYGSRLSP